MTEPRTVHRTALRPGDQLVRPLPRLRGKPVSVTYTVTGYATYRGREYLTVRSVQQGEGSMAVNDLPEQVEVQRGVPSRF
jgi:hypothetical protein